MENYILAQIPKTLYTLVPLPPDCPKFAVGDKRSGNCTIYLFNCYDWQAKSCGESLPIKNIKKSVVQNYLSIARVILEECSLHVTDGIEPTIP